MGILIFANSSNGKLMKSAYEAVYYGSKIAEQLSTTAIALTYGDIASEELEKLGNYGAAKVLVTKDVQNAAPCQLTNLVEQAVQAENSKVIIFSYDHIGKAVAPLVSARLKAGLVAGAADFPNMDGTFTVKKNVFSGNAFAEYEILSDKKIISLLPNSIQIETTDATAEVEEFNAALGNTGITVKEVKKQEGKLSLPEADIVVSGGRGMKGPENWGMIEELAKELGAATACSRPVTDVDWRPHYEHVGQTGTTIRPNLYIAIGISGAIQHLAGVNGSKVMVAINKDPEAPFFSAADYGIVGDAFEVVPKLIEAVKTFKTRVH